MELILSPHLPEALSLCALKVAFTNALAVFQALVNDMVGDMLNKHSILCLDDILIFPEY